MKRITLLSAICLLIGWLGACADTPNQIEATTPSAASPTIAMSTSVTVQSEPSRTQGAVIARPQMLTGRAAHTATLLADGTVLLTGGFATGEQALPSTELFNPETRAFSLIGSMSEARQSHTATLLPDGRVLLAGGFNGDYLASAEIYEPVTGLFTPTGSMAMARSGHVAVLLNNGKVLLTGGTGQGWSFLATSELYDPDSGSFSTTGNMMMPRESHTATLLNSGEILITGGHQGRRSAITIYDSAEIYDPTSGTFALTSGMTVQRHKHDATLLADGRVFISGGSDERDAQGAYISTEIFDPETGTFMPSANMHNARYKHTGTSILLENGQVLLVGGASATEIYDPQSETFREVADSVGMTRFFATVTLLANQEILLAGGYGTDIAADRQAWILEL